MRPRTWFILSVALNLALAGAWYLSWRAQQLPAPLPVPTPPPRLVEAPPKTAVVVRRQNFTWDQVESADYVAYIKNLREIGCPEDTIRDLIVADVNEMFTRRRVTEVPSPEPSWWHTSPDTNATDAVLDKIHALDAERRLLLLRLLGLAWESGYDAMPPALRTVITFSGSLADLSATNKEKVLAVVVRAQEKRQAYVEARRQRNLPPDAQETLQLDRELRGQFVPLMRPDQMEEFLLTYSETARRLRADLVGFELTAEEFRTLFRVRDAIELQPEYYYAGNNPDALKRQAELAAKREDALKTVLGKDRYAAYQLGRDPDYLEARDLVRQVAAPATAIMPLYQISRLTAEEQDQIRADPTLTPEEKVEALAEAQMEQQKAIEQLLGPEAFQKWLEGSPRPGY